MDKQELLEMAKIFDTIITSPSQAVQDAFRNLTVIATLAKANSDRPGPFEQIFSRLDALEYNVETLRGEVQTHNNGLDYRETIDMANIDTMASAGNYISTISIGDITFTDTDTIKIT